MEFKRFNEKIKEQFAKMCLTGKLFRVELSGSAIWQAYLSAFKPEDNVIFRDPESSYHNCNCCHNFIRRYGNIVSINSDGNLESLFSNLGGNLGEYENSATIIDNLITSSEIINVFFETYNELSSLNYDKCHKNDNVFKLGIEKNFKKYTQEEVDKFGGVELGKVYSFDHFNLDLPKQFVNTSGDSIESIMAYYRDKYSMFKKTMEEIPLDTLTLVKDLINQGSLLDGTSHLHSIEEVIRYHTRMQTYNSNRNDNWFWLQAYVMEERTARFKNTLIGVLCTELAEGMELNKACTNWNKRVDPINYHKASAPITQKQIAEAKKFLEDNDFIESFNRRLATIDDIKADEILHLNSINTIGAGVKPSIFDNVKATSTQHKRAEFDKIEEMSIEKFMADVLPVASSIEAYLENRMAGNLAVITTTNAIDDSKPIFKWNNNYSWTFNGNLAGKSQIKKAVKSRGGNVDGLIRISLSFPNTTDDYDLHVKDSRNNHIYYNLLRTRTTSSGMLDLDAQGCDGHQAPEKRVENVTFTDSDKIGNGNIVIWVENYSKKGFHTEFDIEIELNGEITTLRSGKSKLNKFDVGYIAVNGNNYVLHPDQKMNLVESKTVSKEMWGLDSNKFHKVNMLCLSPNHWGNNKVGNLHYMFMLDKCKSNTPIRGFHNENLTPELLKHRKVMEVLGSSAMIEPAERQLAGLGFNSTVKDNLIVKVQGTHKRTLKIKF